MRARLAAALLAAAVTVALTALALQPSLHLTPESATWRRSLHGVTPKGLLAGRGGLLLPGLSRAAAGELRVTWAPASKDTLGMAIHVDGGLTARLGARESSARIPLPAAPADGLRLDFEAEGGALRLIGLEVAPGARPPLGPLCAGCVAAAFVLWRARSAPLRAVLGVAFATGALIAIAAWFPLGAWLWPQGLAALVPALAVGALGLVMAWQAGRRRALVDATLVAAFVFGATARLLFLHSTGSWDTEFWKAWMHTSLERGWTGAYGPAEALPPGHALAQLRGREELWKPVRGGRAFVIDYPPLSLALWTAGHHVVEWAAPTLPAFERDNVAVKLPALCGDLLSLAVLVWAWAPDRRRGLILAALYWALPVSWLSSATLGYFDGVLPPLMVIALVLAGRGRAAWSGAWLALAALVKPTALIAAPAIAVALALHAARNGPARSRRAVVTACSRATLAGLALAVVVLLPYAHAGTLVTAAVHVARLFFQERLSGGYPNVWWLLGHALTADAHGTWLGPVAFAPIALLPFPARPVGTLLFAAGALLVMRRQLVGPRAACLAGASLFLLYGMVGVGVHENHPHPLFLMLLASGVPTRRLRWIGAGAALVYVGDMLALSALGRFHGTRYVWLLPWAQAADGLRMAAGLDLTLPLTLVHVAVLAVALARLGRDMQSVAVEEAA